MGTDDTQTTTPVVILGNRSSPTSTVISMRPWPAGSNDSGTPTQRAASTLQ